jgi:phosphoglycerate dehydrogenase-like enzyme
VTQPEYHRGTAVFGAATAISCVPVPPDEEAMLAAIATSGSRHVIVGSVAYSPRLYEALGRGGVLARYGVGYDSVDKAAATRAGVRCTNTPDVLQQSVAELTLLLIGAAARHLPAMTTTMVAGQWSPREGTELEGRTLALIGCGAIGRAVARIASAGFGMRVIGYSRRAPDPGSELAGSPHFQSVTDDFGTAVRDADFVSLHIPGGPANSHFVNRDRLALMPPRSWLINTARGSVVDEAAMYDALAAGQLRGAALDVFEREPYVPIDPARDLRTLPQVLLLPHVGSNTAEANRRMAARALRNIELALAGDEAGMDLLNPEVLSPPDPG